MCSDHLTLTLYTNIDKNTDIVLPDLTNIIQARAKLPKKRRRVINVDVSEVRKNRTRLSIPKLGVASKLGKPGLQLQFF